MDILGHPRSTVRSACLLQIRPAPFAGVEAGLQATAAVAAEPFVCGLEFERLKPPPPEIGDGEKRECFNQ